MGLNSCMVFSPIVTHARTLPAAWSRYRHADMHVARVLWERAGGSPLGLKSNIAWPELVSPGLAQGLIAARPRATPSIRFPGSRRATAGAATARKHRSTAPV